VGRCHDRGVTQYETTGSGGSGERWNVNLPAVIGVVFVFLVGVIVWVIVSGGDDDEPGAAPDETTTTVVTVPDEGTVAVTTTPAMPDVTSTVPETTTTVPETSTTVPETSTTVPEPTTTAPVTTAPGAEPNAVPGDLAIPGRPMQRPGCDGSFITILASAVGAQATADGIAAILDEFPGSEYLRTDQTCSSLRPDVDGEPIYVVYFGPFVFDTDACAARADGPEEAYAKELSNDVPPDQVVNCG
jgi:hypothetical protein